MGKEAYEEVRFVTDSGTVIVRCGTWNCGVEASAALCEIYADKMESRVVNLLNSEICFSVKTKAAFARRLAEMIRELKYDKSNNDGG